MPHHAETRRRTRHHRSSSWLTGGLLIAGLSVAGVYCIWGDAPLEKTWIQLGFGKQGAADSNSNERSAAAQVPQIDVVEAMEFPGSDPDAQYRETASITEDEPSSPNFLPNRGRRAPVAQNRNPFEAETVANAELDDRFEQENLNQNTASIRTAAFPEEVPSTSSINDRSDEFGTAPVSPTPAPPRPRLGRAGSKNIQLLAGDDAPPKRSGKRPTRPSVNVSPAASNSGSTKLDLNSIQALIDQGEDAEAYHKLSEAYFQHPSQRPLFQNQLDEVAQRIYFSPQTQIQPPYEIQPGDQLRKIASKYQLSWQYLSRLNQVDAKKIRPGKKLKIFQGPFEARVDLSNFELTVLLNGQYVKRYRVGTGKMNTTPIGEFTVREKLENPTYYGPDGMVLEPNDPQNPLGERWIDIGNSFGIHGTIDPESIGKSESAGCVRMRNEDVAEVYDLLTVGSTVTIQR
ncbi:MAG: ErfK/YbiS/YcfS/YnhG family protein [Planctomycetaceae bacterium]|nr:ErfK/YbiS/YcfS/YnhG family protein [Planctomycetaceae bacterium]